MNTYFRCILLLSVAMVSIHQSVAQCTSEIISGHAVLTPNRGCAPFDMVIKNLYSNSTADAIFTVDWGDGTIQTYIGGSDPVDGGALDPLYTPDFSHTYTTGTTQCGHDIVIEATNGCTLPEDARLELQVSIWDTDEVGLNINPGTFRVCQGFAASVQFEDLSDWNCFPRASRQNDPPRWVEWIYEGGTMRIPGITTPSSDGVIGVMGTGSRSQTLNIPVDDPDNPGNPYAVGDEFFVRLNNWNQCNPYPGKLPVTTTANIIIVASPTPDFDTRKEDASNPIQTSFCVDDIVYFDNESFGPAGSSLRYNWTFFDGPSSTDPILATRTTRNPVLSYSVGGTKLVRLSVTDVNAIGGCSSIVEKTINVFPTTIAQINASQTNFCKDEGSSDSFSVTFTDVSTGTNSNTEYRWEFYDETNSLYQAFPGTGYSSTKLGPYTETYINPGQYRVVLYTKDNLTSCFTTDEKYVNVYFNPVADFNNSLACEGQDVELYNLSSLTTVNGNLIESWQWDYDYNGTFSADETFSGSMSDTIVQNFTPGLRQIALRVTEDQNGCFNTFIKNVEVFRKPNADFSKDKVNGCSPVELTLTNDGHASQPVSIDRYLWSANYGGGYEDTLIQLVSSPTFTDTAALVFENRTSASKYFPFKLTAISVDGCIAESLPDSVEVFPSIKPGFNDLNYDPLADNCSPIDVTFQVDAPTMALNPSGYEWNVTLAGNNLHSETTPPSNPQFSYEFDATGINVNNFRVSLRANFPGICTSDSIMTIKVNPIPVSEFNIDTIDYNCDKVIVSVDAIQKGLVEYNWTILDDMFIYPIDTLGDRFTYEIDRNAPGLGNKKLGFYLQTSNFSLCESGITKDSITVLPQDDMSTSFSAIPTDLVYPNTTVFLTNSTNTGAWEYAWDFGDGETTTARDPGYHVYDWLGSYKINLTVKNEFCTEIDTQTVNIIAPPLYVDFDYNPEIGCSPLTVNFENRSINAVPSTYYWDFGDGNSSVVQNPTYTYTQPGTYTVSLRASNAGGLTFTEVKNDIIVVVEPPEVNIAADPASQIFPNTIVNIENNSIPKSANPSYLWHFGDGIYTIEENPEMHIFEFPGEYFIKLSITENQCTRSDSVGIIIGEPLPAIIDFDYKPGSGCAPITVEFVNLTIGADESTYVWDFGDGQGESYEKNPAHTFYEPGTYSVTLRASNIMGVESVVMKEAIIIAHSYPEANFTIDPDFQVFPDATVNISNESIAPGRTYSWDFGDGNLSQAASPGSHRYPEPGEYKITYSVSENGCKSTDSTKIFIKPIPPIVEFEYTPDNGCAPLTVEFTNLSQYADPATYQWDFGDGYGKSNVEHPVYTYYEPGIYSVTLSATNKSGVVVMETKEQIIKVFEHPIASFYARPEEVNVPDEPIHLTNRSHGATQYQWDFGDGSSSFDAEPIHQYTETGSYDITLIAINDDGCSDTLFVEKAIEGVLDDLVRVPNAFTPSLDGPTGGFIRNNGKNDVFYPVTRGVTQYQMQIFTRWGELIFDTKDKNYGWDGYHRGRICPQDVYIYKVNVKYLDGQEETLFGDVTLIR